MKNEKKLDLFSVFYKNSLLVEAVIIFVAFHILTGGTFTGPINISNIIMQGATYAIMSITMCMVIITGNADLSAGRFLGMLSMISAIIMVNNTNLPASVVLILSYVVAIVIGLWHGFWIGYMKLPAFIITLATQLVFQGVTQLISGGRVFGPARGIISEMGSGYLPSKAATVAVGVVIVAAYVLATVSKENKAIKQGLAEPRWGKVLPKMIAVCVLAIVVVAILVQHKGFAYAMLIMLGLTVLVSYVSNNTKFGRYVYAIGGNKEAAALSGINVPKETLKLYVLHAIIVTTAAMVYVGRLGSATAASGMGYEFTSITGCVVGGVAITGGRGTVIGAVVGTLIMAALENGMSIMNLDPAVQYIVKGAVLLFAIALDAYANNRKAKTVQQA